MRDRVYGDKKKLKISYKERGGVLPVPHIIFFDDDSRFEISAEDLLELLQEMKEKNYNLYRLIFTKKQRKR